ncbi:MAG: hypothetical protein ACI38Q_03950 [Candidatus Bruticola sp.]
MMSPIFLYLFFDMPSVWLLVSTLSIFTKEEAQMEGKRRAADIDFAVEANVSKQRLLIEVGAMYNAAVGTEGTLKFVPFF